MSFGLEFVGKAAALAQIARAPETVLELRGEGSPEHVLIEGDNLEALRVLAGAYSGRVQMIYIDPPYNTGNDFVYRDRYALSAEAYRAELAAHGALVSNPKSAGRFHSAWLSMMLPRLALGRQLLAPDGLCFVSIDDNEVHRVRMLLDEVFGEDCFIAQVTVVTNRGGRDYLRIATGHEYLLVYGATPSASVRELPKGGPAPKYDDDRGPYELRELRNRNPRFTPDNRPNLAYPIYVDPATEDAHGCCPVSLEPRGEPEICVVPRNSKGGGSVWRWGKPKLAAALVPADPQASEVVARQRRDGGFNIYEKHRKRTTKAKGLWDDSAMRTEQGTIELRRLLGAAVFDHPKPVALVRRCLALATDPDDAIVLDFFAGSGTTAHAVIEQNAADGGKRRSLCIQLDAPTPSGSAAAKAGYPTLCSVTRARLEKVLGAPLRRFGLEDDDGRPQPRALWAILQRCGLGPHATVRTPSVAGWTVAEDGPRWVAVSMPGASLRDLEVLDPPDDAVIWLAADVGTDAERVALAQRFGVRTEYG